MRGKTAPKPTWEAVKADYLLGRGSCRELAERYQLSLSAVASRAKREKWKLQLDQTEQRLAAKVETELDRRATTWADMAEAFRHKSANDVREFLARVDSERERLRAGDVEALAKLISGCWKPAVEIGRKTFDLDHQQPLEVLNVPTVRVGIVLQSEVDRGPTLDADIPNDTP